MNHNERSAACTAKQLTPDPDGIWHHLWVWHPQWGGYVGHCKVDFAPTDSNSCFEMAVFHDGEFPCDHADHKVHCCDAIQFVTFGLDVYEAQLGFPGRVREEARETLAEARDRIDRLIAGLPTEATT